MYLNQYWKDERLSFSPEENRVLTLSGDFAEKIWVPDTFFANDKNRYVLTSKSNFDLSNRETDRASLFAQLPARRDRAEQDGAAERGRLDHVRDAVHHDAGVHDGLALLPARLAELHRRNREL